MQQEYQATNNWPYSISSGCVVYRVSGDKTEVLLLRRNPDHSYNPTGKETYSLPKGHLKRTETLEEAAARETKEEAGVNVAIKFYLGSTVRTFTHPVYKVKNEKTIHYFAAEWKNDLPHIDAEHDKKIWVSLEEAADLLTNLKSEDEIIERFKAYLRLYSAA